MKRSVNRAGTRKVRHKRSGSRKTKRSHGLTTREMPFFVKLWLGPAPFTSRRAMTRIEFIRGLSRSKDHTIAALIRDTGRSRTVIADDLANLCAAGALKKERGRYSSTARLGRLIKAIDRLNGTSASSSRKTSPFAKPKERAVQLSESLNPAANLGIVRGSTNINPARAHLRLLR